ncbi:MAG: ATP synthase F1 subunit delta [Ruminococcus sp.]|nr:ATP synthase F1 subunit delta [Ruminococcus sp.]
MAGSVEKVYAKALLEIAAEDGSVKELSEELDALSGIFSDNPELCGILNAPTVAENDKIGLIKTVFEGRISECALNFLCVLAEKGRCACLEGIADEFREGYYGQAGISEVKVTTAVKLNGKARKNLISKLEKLYGGKVTLKEKIDPAIIGGMIVTCGDSMLDGSVRHKLEKMHDQIKDMAAG